MEIEWKAPEQKYPLVMRSDMKKYPATMLKDVTKEVVDKAKIARVVEFADGKDRTDAHLSFEVAGSMAKIGAQTLWLHLLDLDFVVEIKYPNGGRVKTPKALKVVVHKQDEQVVVDVDGVQYHFLHVNMADPQIREQIEDPKEMVCELIRDVVDRAA